MRCTWHTSYNDQILFVNFQFVFAGTCDFLLFYKSGPNFNCHLVYGESAPAVIEVGQAKVNQNPAMMIVNFRITFRLACSSATLSLTLIMNASPPHRFSPAPGWSVLKRTNSYQGNCPSDGCSDPCFDCKQEESECSGVRWSIFHFPHFSSLCSFSQISQGSGLQHGHPRSHNRQHLKQRGVSTNVHRW